ncbi:uncharacterized protein UTRI_00358 [Ustilago trichophora]|uniref:Uncharacterized protein n=1 Tax=Ustilago trichophora TaxID=86804 RepID=A0A5C3DUH2_9BASI|nr:uncharacterized protein UTRI_00358 [Ustilago trichophora]
MKLQATLFAVSVAIFAAADAAAYIWLDDTATDNYEAYCTPGGAKVNSKYACLKPYEGFFGEIDESSQFQGYISKDSKAFVVINDANYDPIIIKTASWGDNMLSVEINTEVGEEGPNGKMHNCANAAFEDAAGNILPHGGWTSCHPDGGPISLPKQAHGAD